MESIIVFIHNSKKNLSRYDTINILSNELIYKTHNNEISITIGDDFFNIKSIENIIKKYEYFAYLDNNYDVINKYDCIKQSVEILKNNANIDQVIFGKANNNLINDSSNLSTCDIDQFVITDDWWRKYELMSEIFINKTNPYMKNDNTVIDYVNYATMKFNDIINFKLVPSLIKTNSLFKSNLPLKICSHSEYLYGMDLEKYKFKSDYLNNTITKKIIEKTDITIVTGFLDFKINREPKRPSQVYSYIEKSYPTLSIKQNMIIYISEELKEHVIKIRTNIGMINNTKIVIVTKENLFMLNKLNKVIENVKKNIIPYNNDYLLLLVNTRYNYMTDALNHNYFNTNYFVWIDFSAGHIVDIPEDLKLKFYDDDKIRIAWISRFDKSTNTFKFNHNVMGGGVFGGHRYIMKEFIKLHNLEFEELLNKGYCINDDKLLFFMFEKYPCLFSTYFSGYKSLLTKF